MIIVAIYMKCNALKVRLDILIILLHLFSGICKEKCHVAHLFLIGLSFLLYVRKQREAK